MSITLETYPDNVTTTAANRQSVDAVNFTVNLSAGLSSLQLNYSRAIGLNSANTDSLTGDELFDGSFLLANYPEGPFSYANIEGFLADSVTQSLITQNEADTILQQLKDFVAAGRNIGMTIHSLRSGLGLAVNPVVASNVFTS